MVLRLLLSLLLACGLRATTSAVVASVSNTQAIIHVTTDQAGNCTYRISESATLSPLVHDVDAALFSGADSDARVGSIVSGGDHKFVAGARTAAKGADGKFYSRALAAYTQHWYGVTCGADAEVTGTFTTGNIPTGNTFVDPLPFDPAGLGNYAIPTWDFSTPVVDPQTGQKLAPVTGPGQATFGLTHVTTSAGTTDSAGTVAAANLTGTNWTLTGVAAGTYSAVGQDPLVVRLMSTLGRGAQAGNFNWQNMLAQTGQYRQLGVDSLQATLTGSGDLDVDVALTWNGVDQGTEWRTVHLPASSGTASYPSALSAMLGAWQGPNYPIVPGVLFQQAEMQPWVNTSGTQVTAVTYAQDGNKESFFPLDTRLLKAGSRITIAGAEYVVASVDSAQQLTLTTSAGSHTAVRAYLQNFGVIVRRHAGAVGTIALSDISVTMAVSQVFANGAAGFQNYCSSQTSTDSTGQVGRFCIFPGIEAGIYWITNDLQSRFISRAWVQASSGGDPADAFNGGSYGQQSIFDSTDPNAWYASVPLTATGHPALVKVAYTPAGGNCTTWNGRSVPGDYQRFPLQSDWTNGLDNCHLSYTNITKPSLGQDIYSQLLPELKTGRFADPGFSFIQGGKAIFLNNGQDRATWVIILDLTTHLITGQFSSYKNLADASCRFCSIHGPFVSNATDGYFMFSTHDLGEESATGGTDTADGPQIMVIATPLTDQISDMHACSGVVDSAVSWLVPYVSGCNTITFSGTDNIPCDPDPSAFETANDTPCTIPGHSGTQFEGGAVRVGDWLLDPATGYEVGVLGHHTGGQVWELMRNIKIPHGPRLTDAVNDFYLKNHAANSVFKLQCNHTGNIVVSAAETNGVGLFWDQKYYSLNHSVFRHAGNVSIEIYYDVFGTPPGFSVRLGTIPGTLSQKETHRILGNPPFAGKVGLTLGPTGSTQSHPGWLSGDTAITDFNPLGPNAGGSFWLGSQTSTQVGGSGQLYKIARGDLRVAPDKRRRAQGSWSGRFNLLDVSGAGIDNTTAHSYHYCTVDYLPGGGCGQAGESVGDAFLNVPQATLDGAWGGAFDLNRMNSVTLATETIAATEFFINADQASYDGMNVNDGKHERRLTTMLSRYNGQDTYSNLKVLDGGNVGLVSCAGLNMQRVSDICMLPMLPEPPAEAGNDFMAVSVSVPTGHTYSEVQFGYAEFGAPDAFFCTTRQEACNTSHATDQPFAWEAERVLQACAPTCSVPVLPDHTAYYRTRTSDDGTTWTNGPLQVVMAPSPGGAPPPPPTTSISGVHISGASIQ